MLILFFQSTKTVFIRQYVFVQRKQRAKTITITINVYNVFVNELYYIGT